jgi:hypothetical protein
VYDLQFNYFLEDTKSENEARIILLEILIDIDVENTQAAFQTASDRFALGHGRYRFIQSQKVPAGKFSVFSDKARQMKSRFGIKHTM